MDNCHCFPCLFGEYFAADESRECTGYVPCTCNNSHP